MCGRQKLPTFGRKRMICEATIIMPSNTTGEPLRWPIQKSRSYESSNTDTHLRSAYLLKATRNFKKQHKYQPRIYPIAQQLATTSVLVGEITNNVGLILADRGNLAQAESYYLEALKTFEKWVPSGDYTGSELQNLGEVRFYVGDYAEAEAYLSRPLKLFRQVQHTFPKLDPFLRLHPGTSAVTLMSQ